MSILERIVRATLYPKIQCSGGRGGDTCPGDSTNSDMNHETSLQQHACAL